MKDIVDTAVGAGSFTTLVAAVKAAGLVDTLKGAGPFTVFAPTDEAFAKLPAGTVDGLLKDIPKLTAVLTYHVVAGKVMAADVLKLDGKEAKTVQGGAVKISTAGGVKLNGTSTVTTTGHCLHQRGHPHHRHRDPAAGLIPASFREGMPSRNGPGQTLPVAHRPTLPPVVLRHTRHVVRYPMTTRLTPAAALAALPATGKAFVLMFTHGTLEVEFYQPKGTDPQKPHTRDEVYVVVSGRGVFVNGDARQPFEAGEVLFAAAGDVHRFEDFTDDFATWVFFHGPEGGERPG